MWTFVPLLFVFWVSTLCSAVITRLSAPGLWHATQYHAQYLAIIDKTPEIEISSYIVFILSFTILSLCIFLLTQYAYGRFEQFRRFIFHVDFIAVIYVLATCAMNPLKGTTMILLIPVSIIYILLHKTTLSRYINELSLRRCFAMFLLFRGGMLIVLYDIGVYRRVLLSHYPYILAGSVIFFMGLKAIRNDIYEAARKKLTLSKIAVASFVLIAISLVVLIRKDNSIEADIYFTLLPAYHLLHGGVPFVSMMSQYGLLYIVPWAMWLKLFPALPSPYVGAAIMSAILLTIYFGMYIFTLTRMFKRASIFLLTVMAGFYITILVRDWGFADPISLVSAPAFTPLRFGMFIVPLWFLLSYWKIGAKRFLVAFVLASTGLFFYSFEMGVSLLAAAGGVIVIVLTEKKLQWQDVVHWVVAFLSPLVLWYAVFVGYAQIKTGTWPNVGEYAYFSLLFGQGFFLHAMGGHYIIVFLLGITAVAMYFGSYLFFQKKDKFGLVVLYLAFVQLTQVPYYMGRSVFPTLYNISLPFILLCACMAEYMASRWTRVRNSIVLCAFFIVCIATLYIPGVRGLRITISLFLHSAEEIERTATYIHGAFTQWAIKDTPQFKFLSLYLPPDCHLVGFDFTEPELLMALDRKPAFQYAFVRGFITNKEQVDGLRTDASSICVFVNHTFIRSQDQFVYGVYNYFWERYGQYATEIAGDRKADFTLHKMSTLPFVASQ